MQYICSLGKMALLLTQNYVLCSLDAGFKSILTLKYS